MNKEVYVYNFGRAYYYSSQELILFQTLLLQGQIPNVVIFLDGLNDFVYTPQRVGEKREEWVVEMSIIDRNWIRELPISRLAMVIAELANRVAAKVIHNRQPDKASSENRKDIIASADRYFENKKLIEAMAAVYNISTVFVWQPIPAYKYDLKNHYIWDPATNRKLFYLHDGYQHMEKLRSEKHLGNNFLWTADLQEGLQGSLYVDRVHYSPKMSEILAFSISKFLLEHYDFDRVPTSLVVGE
jgi:hypothetical protein